MRLALVIVKLALGSVGAAVLLGLLISGGQRRWIWRMLSALGLGTGVGFLVGGILLAAMKHQPTLNSPPGIIAIGAGTLTASIALLVISYCGGCSPRQ